MNTHLVSIIMPFKNTTLFIEDCIVSIIEQTYLNWELIAVNDHSTDDSLKLVENLVLKDKRILVLPNDGNGIIRALQTGYKHCHGSIITRMDSDDLMPSDKLEKMVTDLVAFGRKHIALGLVKYFPEDKIGEGYQKYEYWLNQLTISGKNFEDIYKECVIASPCWMVWKEDFDDCGGFQSELYPEDYDLVFRFYAHHFKCISSNNLLHLWRDYPTRTSRTHENYAYNAFLELKVHHFLNLNYNKRRPLVVWGAGKKGKIVASLLQEHNIDFQWICDNPNKIGKTIYNKKMLPITTLKKIENAQSIITVAYPKAQKEIRNFFEKNCKKNMLDYFFFC